MTCHQPNGKGLDPAFPPLEKSEWVTGDPERLIKMTLYGLMGPIEVNGKKYDGQVPMTPFGGLLNDNELAEGGVRAPFIVCWPGHTPAGVKNDTTVFSAVDLLPTFCAAAGVTPPIEAQGDGENLIAAFNGETVARTRPIFWFFTGKKSEPDWWPRLAVRDGDWKLVTTDDGKRVELHNLKSNRAEDAAKDQSKDHPEIVARLTKLALDWKATLPTEANPECRSAKPSEPKPDKPEKPARKASGVTPAVRAKAFARWDADKDDVLTPAEYQAGLKGQNDLEARCKRFDKNGDGKLTREEFVGASTK